MFDTKYSSYRSGSSNIGLDPWLHTFLIIYYHNLQYLKQTFPPVEENQAIQAWYYKSLQYLKQTFPPVEEKQAIQAWYYKSLQYINYSKDDISFCLATIE